MSLPWLRLYREALKKDNSLIFGITRLPEREDDFLWITPLASEEDSMVYLYGINHERNKHLSKADILNKNNFALCESGMADCGFLNDFGFEEENILRIPSSDNPAQLELMTLRGRADFILGFEKGIKRNLNLLGSGDNALIPVAKVKKIEVYLAASKIIKPSLLKKVEAAIKPKEVLPKLTILATKYPPFVDVDENGNVIGSMVSKVKAFLDSKEVDYLISIVPWERAFQSAQTRENTLIFALNRTPEREGLFHWILPLTTQKYYIFGRNTPEFDGISKEQLLSGNYKPICENKTSQCQELESFGFKKEEIVIVNGLSSGVIVNLVANKRADLLIENMSTVYGYLKSLGLPENTLMPIIETKTYTDFLAGSKYLDPRIVERLLNKN